MAQIKKLMIQGIRSFDPDGNSHQTIEFYSPLTLIVGQNGCGKTTVIEALKYAITSDFPPGTSKAGSFVHDPKLSTGYEVPAMVKLELRDKNNDRVVVTRRLKATLKGKGGNISTATVEACVRRVDAAGNVFDISGKCADVKEEMSRLMGVSDAIMNHVIFCHQEDSCWPLDEGKKVKERFDAIFNTTMYMKALDHLGKKDKLMQEEIKRMDLKFQHSQVMVKELTSKKNQAEALSAEIKSITDSIEKSKKEALELDEKLRQLSELEKDYTKAVAAVDSDKTKITESEKFIEEQVKLIGKVEDGNINELHRAAGNYKVAEKQKEQKLRKMTDELNSKQAALADLYKQKDNINKEEGKFAAAENANRATKSNMKMLTDKIIGVMRALQMDSQDTSFTASANNFLDAIGNTGSSDEVPNPEIVLKALTSAHRVKSNDEKKIINEFNDRRTEIQSKINKLIESRTSVDTEIQMKSQDCKKNSQEAAALRERLINLEGSGDTLALLEDEIEQNDDAIKKIESSGVITKYDEEIQKLQSEIKELKIRFDKTNTELNLLRKDSELSEKIQSHNKNKVMKQNECTDILRKHEDEVRMVLGSIPAGEWNAPLNRKVDQLNMEIKTKEKEQQVSMKKLSAKEAEKNHLADELTKKERQLEVWKDQIIDVLDGSTFDEAYEESTEKLAEARRDNYYNEAAQYLFKKYMQKLKTRNCCPLCKRDFQSKKEGSELVENIEEEVGKLQEGQPAEAAKVEKLEERNKTLTEIKPICEDKSTLENVELPELRRRKNKLDTEVEQLIESNQELVDSLDVLRNDAQSGNKLKSVAVIYDRNTKEIRTLENQIKEFEQKRDPAVKGCTLTLGDAEVEYEMVQGAMSTKSKEKENKETLRSRKLGELHKAKDEKNKLVQQKLTLQSELQNRESLETKKRELEALNKELEAAIDELKKQLPSIKSKLNIANNELKAETDENKIKLDAIRKELTELEKQRDQVKSLKVQLEQFEMQKEEYAGKQVAISKCKTKVKELENSLENLRKDSQELKDELSASTVKLTAIRVSISIKKKEEELQELREGLKTKEEALKSTENKGVGPEKRQVSSKLSTLTAQMNKYDGQRVEKQQALATIKKDLTSREKPYHNAEAQYKENLINKVIHEKARKDVKIYKTALEHAVLTFHQKKMETINRYLKYIWKKVYKGNDIDYIQIKTDNEDADKPKNTVKIDLNKNRRKSYNYRVIMIRRGVELDMRGRCSAGQKILASIIIRLALAQTFSTRCGVISLDEPTTNLDKANIDSLAECLSDLALDMKDTKTFQLIVITHDQDFIDKLLHVDPVDYYFKISRNQNGHSKIERTLK